MQTPTCIISLFLKTKQRCKKSYYGASFKIPLYLFSYSRYIFGWLAIFKKRIKNLIINIDAFLKRLCNNNYLHRSGTYFHISL